MGKGIEGYGEIQNSRLKSIDSTLREIREMLTKILNRLPEQRIKEKKTLLKD